MINIAIEAAKAAGQVIEKGFNQTHSITYKLTLPPKKVSWKS